MNRRIAPEATDLPYLEAHPDRTIASVLEHRGGEAMAVCVACRHSFTATLRHTPSPACRAAKWVRRHNAARHPRRAALDLPANNP